MPCGCVFMVVSGKSDAAVICYEQVKIHVSLRNVK
jgi:hypothetical protein